MAKEDEDSASVRPPRRPPSLLLPGSARHGGEPRALLSAAAGEFVADFLLVPTPQEIDTYLEIAGASDE